MRNLRYGLQEKSAHRFNTLADILSKIARKVSKNRKFKLNQQALIKYKGQVLSAALIVLANVGLQILSPKFLPIQTYFPKEKEPRKKLMAA